MHQAEKRRSKVKQQLLGLKSYQANDPEKGT
jgi:hypothetical protein